MTTAHNSGGLALYSLFHLLRSTPVQPDCWELCYTLWQGETANATLWRQTLPGGRKHFRVRLVRLGQIVETDRLANPFDLAAFLGFGKEEALGAAWSLVNEQERRMFYEWSAKPHPQPPQPERRPATARRRQPPRQR